MVDARDDSSQFVTMHLSIAPKEIFHSYNRLHGCLGSVALHRHCRPLHTTSHTVQSHAHQTELQGLETCDWSLTSMV